ncbi:MAG: sigma-70 family RNA polymerase sigma factor [Bacillota bacterium]
MEDDKIIELYFSRNEQAITETKMKFERNLKGLSFNITKNAEDAEECLNDTYKKIWDTIPPQRPTYLFAYIAKICRNICFGKLDYAKAKNSLPYKKR